MEGLDIAEADACELLLHTSANAIRALMIRKPNLFIIFSFEKQHEPARYRNFLFRRSMV